jgi:hypothetical protein
MSVGTHPPGPCVRRFRHEMSVLLIPPFAGARVIVPRGISMRLTRARRPDQELAPATSRTNPQPSQTWLTPSLVARAREPNRLCLRVSSCSGRTVHADSSP